VPLTQSCRSSTKCRKRAICASPERNDRETLQLSISGKYVSETKEGHKQKRGEQGTLSNYVAKRGTHGRGAKGEQAMPSLGGTTRLGSSVRGSVKREQVGLHGRVGWAPDPSSVTSNLGT